MTKDEKISSLSSAMTQSERDGDESDTYYHFTDTAPSKLTHLFFDHYEIKDIDYKTFSRACDIVSEIYTDTPDISQDDAIDIIYRRAPDSASVYTFTRLQYLDANNQDDITDILKEYPLSSISEACAVWYDRQVEQAAVIINEWINA